MKIGISFATNALKNLWSSVSTFFSGKTVNVKTKGSTTKKADGGVFSGGSWKPIKKYAVGGLPNMGQMFVAREAGPELVGTLGGHTAVMNNDQIVASVSDGVYRAVKAAMGNGQPVNVTFKVEADSKEYLRLRKKKRANSLIEPALHLIRYKYNDFCPCVWYNSENYIQWYKVPERGYYEKL